MAFFGSESSASRTEAGGTYALVVILALLSTILLDAYAFSTFVGS